MQLVLPPTVEIKDFCWHLIVPLKHSVLYFKKIREPGDEASVSSTVCMSLSPTQLMYGHTICDVPSIQV